MSRYKPYLKNIEIQPGGVVAFDNATSVLLPSTGVTGQLAIENIDAAGLTIATVQMTATDIKAAHTTPFELLAAPDTGKFNLVEWIVGKMTFGTAAFVGNNALEIRETDGSGTKICTDFPYTGFLLISSGSAVFHSIAIGGLRLTAHAIVAAVPSADPTGTGAVGYIDFQIAYRLITP